MRTPLYLISDESSSDWNDYRLGWWIPVPGEEVKYKRMEEIRIHHCKQDGRDIITLQHDHGKDDCHYSWNVKSEAEFIKTSFRSPKKVTEQEYKDKRREILEIYNAYIKEKIDL